MRILPGVALLLTAVFASRTALSAPPAANHPLLGVWTVKSADGQCVESYQFRANGTSVVTSGEEVSETTFEVSVKPDAKNFYKFSDKVTRGNGKKDCAGEVTQIGRSETSYLQFDPRNELVIMCKAASLDACFGPLRRVPEGK